MNVREYRRCDGPSSRCGTRSPVRLDTARAVLVALAAAVALAGCGGMGNVFGGAGGQAGAGAGGAGAGGMGDGGGGGTGGEVPSGPVIRIHLRATTAPFEHNDGLAGQTPIAHSSGMRSFKLLKTAGDPSPLTIFDYGTGFVEAGYDDGDDTVVATVDPKGLAAGTYTIGRVVHSHVRYRVAATMHASGYVLPGEFDNLQVMSDGTLLDGVLRDRGYYVYVFHTLGNDYSQTGNDAPVPEYLGSGGFSVKIEGGEWAYYFPVQLVISPDIQSDIDVVMEVNMHESFRWQDEALPEYQAGVLDTTPVASEPVERFGANSQLVYSE